MDWISIFGRTWAEIIRQDTLSFIRSSLNVPTNMSNNQYRSVTHCIFDMDGLLLDTEQLYTEAINRIGSPYGKKWTWEHKARTMGATQSEFMRYVVEILELPLTPEQVGEQALKLYKELFPHTKLLPGAERLLRHLKKNNIPIALATGFSKDTYKLKTQNLSEVFKLFNHKVLGCDPGVKKGKPSPDIFLIAASRFHDKPDTASCLVFEDAPNGVQAAIDAGMQAVMIPDPNLPSNLTGKATLVLNSLEDFKPEQFGLPAYPK